MAPQGDAAVSAICTATERSLLVSWAEALEISDVGIDDTFLDLGGESISGTLCANRIRGTIGVEIPLAVFLSRNTTIRTLAAAIDGGAYARIDR